MKNTILILLLATINFSPYAKANEVALEEELKWLRAENTIEVVSKRKEDKNTAAGIVSIMSSDEIERYNAKNLSDLLNHLTSIYTLGSGLFLDNMVSMRGDLFTHHSNHILVLINGRPCRDTYTGGLNSAIYRDFPIHAIEKLEVIRGPGSVLYGTNAYAGVINIVTKKNKNNGLTLRGGYGSFNTGRGEMEMAYKDKEVAMTAAMRYNSSDGWLFSTTGIDGQIGGFRAREQDTSGTFWGQWHDITLNGFVASSQHNHWGALSLGNGHVMTDEKVFLDLGFKHQFNSHWSSQWNLTYNYVFNNFMVNIPNNNFPITLVANDLLFEQTHFFNFFDNQLNFLIGGSVEWQNESLAPIYNHLKASIYGEANYYIVPNLKFNIGGQWNRVERSLLKKVDVNPVIEGLVGRLGLVYEMTEHLGFKVLYSQAFRDPAIVELNDANTTLFTGSSALKPEKVATLDAQVYYQAKNYQLSLTAFESKQTDLIERVPGANGLDQYKNVGTAIFEGIEFESKIKPMTDLQLTGSYTFQTNKDNQGHNNVTFVPNHIAKMGLSYDLTPQWQLSVFDTFFSAAKTSPSIPVVNPPADSYHNLSLNTRYQLNQLLGLNKTKAITFSLFATNLLDEKFYYPAITAKSINTIPATPGRTLFGELTIEF